MKNPSTIKKSSKKERVVKVKGISEREGKCLIFLAQCFFEDDERCWRRFSSFVEYVKFDERKVRLAVRSLRRKGLVEFEHLFDDDGFIAGSGHCISPKGNEFFKENFAKDKIISDELFEELLN